MVFSPLLKRFPRTLQFYPAFGKLPIESAVFSAGNTGDSFMFGIGDVAFGDPEEETSRNPTRQQRTNLFSVVPTGLSIGDVPSDKSLG
jgi:hypothetical protein